MAMESHTARKLVPLVNSPEFADAIIVYHDSRLADLYKDLEQATLGDVSEIQGRIKELRRLLNLKETVLDKAR